MAARSVVFRGQKHELVAMLVTSRDHLGRPLTARFVHDEDKVDLREASAGGKPVEFITALVNKETWGGAPPENPATKGN